MRRTSRMLVSALAAAYVAAGPAASAVEDWPHDLTIHFPGQERYGNQAFQGGIAWYRHGSMIPPRGLLLDFACHLVGGCGRRQFNSHWCDPLCLTMRGGGEAAFVCGLDVEEPEI